MKVCRAGFTLLELMVVVMVGSLLMLIAMPHVDVAGARAESAARSARMALAAAQQRAVLRQHDVVVEFDEGAAALLFFDDANRNGVRDAGEQAWSHALEDGMRFGRGLAPEGPAGGAAVGFGTGAGGRRTLVFHRSGSASEAGGFYVSSPRAAVSEAHVSDAYALVVSRATGRVRLLRLAGRTWQEAF